LFGFLLDGRAVAVAVAVACRWVGCRRWNLVGQGDLVAGVAVLLIAIVAALGRACPLLLPGRIGARNRDGGAARRHCEDGGEERRLRRPGNKVVDRDGPGQALCTTRRAAGMERQVAMTTIVREMTIQGTHRPSTN